MPEPISRYCYNGLACLKCKNGFYNYNFDNKFFICDSCKNVWEVEILKFYPEPESENTIDKIYSKETHNIPLNKNELEFLNGRLE